MKKKLFLALSCASVFALLSSTAAHANVFNFSFTGPSDSGSGSMTANPTGTAGMWLITSITGVTDGQNISTWLPINSYPGAPFATNDNDLFFPTATVPPNTLPAYLDLNGVSYQLANGTNVNLYYGVFGTGDPQVYNIISGVSESNRFLTSFAVTAAGPAPEPGSLVLLGTGMVGMLGMVRRRFAA